MHAPAAVIENFSYAAAALAADGEAGMPAVLDLASRSGIELLGPVPETLQA